MYNFVTGKLQTISDILNMIIIAHHNLSSIYRRRGIYTYEIACSVMSPSNVIL